MKFHLIAPDPSSQQTCSIGGNVANNAGGPHCLAEGVTNAHVLGAKVVLPDGELAARLAEGRPLRDVLIEAIRYGDLPENARRYLERIEELAGIPLDIISTGADRGQTIVRRHPFDVA